MSIARAGSSTTPSRSTSSRPCATSAAHSRRVPKPCVKSRSAGFTVRAIADSGGELEDDDLVVGHGPGAADDALAVELADDRPRVAS